MRKRRHVSCSQQSQKLLMISFTKAVLSGNMAPKILYSSPASDLNIDLTQVLLQDQDQYTAQEGIN